MRQGLFNVCYVIIGSEAAVTKYFIFPICGYPLAVCDEPGLVYFAASTSHIPQFNAKPCLFCKVIFDLKKQLAKKVAAQLSCTNVKATK